MTQQVFAQSIGLSPATLSSIFNGRTNPTLNIVEAIKKKIPNISTEWLMFGTEPMYLDAERSSSAPQKQESDAYESVINFDMISSPTSSTPEAPAQTVQRMGTQPALNYNGVRNTRSETVREEVKIIDKPQRRVTEIRVFYDDQTWDAFVPAKK